MPEPRIALMKDVNRLGPDETIRICWPRPDRVCLQSGCTWCQDSLHRKTLRAVGDYAIARDWAEDFRYGLRHNWQIEVHETRERQGR